MSTSETNTAIYEIREKQAELSRLIHKLESKQVRRLDIPQQNIELNEGEHYAGTILSKEPGNSHHLILLPQEQDKETDWDSAMKWAASVGGSLPTRSEQSLLYANLKDQFKPNAYWSSEQHAESADYAWVQYFGDSNQSNYRKVNDWRARAVRRIRVG